MFHYLKHGRPKMSCPAKSVCHKLVRGAKQLISQRQIKVEMDCHEDRIKFEAFKAQTTHQNDYRWYCDAKKVPNRLQGELSEKTFKPRGSLKFQDYETYSIWREGVHIPFNALLRPKSITQTNPNKPYNLEVLPIDDKKEEVIKSRPRIYMTPAVSMDDVPDPEMRKLLCQRMYTTEWRNAEKEAALSVHKHTTFHNTVEKSCNPVKLNVELQKPISYKYRMIAKQWDESQTRACVDPTKAFWIQKGPSVKCGACVDPLKDILPQEVKGEITALIKDDKLRLAHAKPMSSYAGYIPQLSQGVSLGKKELPVVHPYMSTAQAITSRYVKDKSTK